MYSMYPWDKVTGASDADVPARPDEPDFTAALQFALDRRDNGGDAARRQEGLNDLRGTNGVSPAPPKGNGYDVRGTTPAPPKGKG
jgi:hypothetical protein